MTIFATLASVTLRALLGRRRTLLMVLLAAMPVLLGLLVRANEDELRAEVLEPTIDGLVIRVVLPLIALLSSGRPRSGWSWRTARASTCSRSPSSAGRSSSSRPSWPAR